MTEFGYDLLSLFLGSVWPIWLAALVVGAVVFYVSAGYRTVVRLGLGLVIFASSLLFYAVMARPGYEDWRFSTRIDRLRQDQEPPILIQSAFRLERDPSDRFAYAAVGDYFAAKRPLKAEEVLYADFSYREAEKLGGLSADQYANWASIVIETNLDLFEGYADRLDRLIAAALAQDPKHVRALFLATERLPRSEALPKLYDLEAAISPSHPLAEMIDERILLITVGEQPSIAPDFDALSKDRVADVIEDASKTGEPPFMQMVRNLEAQVTRGDGRFLQATGDAEADEALALALFRLGRLRLQLGLIAEARAAFFAVAEMLEADDGLQFWLAMNLWFAGEQSASMTTLEAFRGTLPDGSPQWRAVGQTLTRLQHNGERTE